MSVLGNDRLDVLDYLKKSIKCMREIAESEPSAIGESIRLFADQIADDTAKFEAELIAAGLLARPANQP